MAQIPTTTLNVDEPVASAALVAAFNRLVVAVEAQTRAIRGSTFVVDEDLDYATSASAPSATPTPATTPAPASAPALSTAPAPTAPLAPAIAPAPTAALAPVIAPAPAAGVGGHINTPDELAALLVDTESATGSWFLVTQGIEPGIYSSWLEAAPLVVGVSRCVHTKQGSKWEALGEYAKAWDKGGVIRRM